eukprot:scaffold210176_cov17-Tisochrysis_lutea.AAC.1
MRRKLDSRLYLLVNQQLQALPSSQWQFPFAQHQGDEPISSFLPPFASCTKFEEVRLEMSLPLIKNREKERKGKKR